MIKFLLPLLWVFSLWAQPFSYHIDLYPRHLSLLDTLHITVTLTYPEGYEPNIDTMRRHLLDLNDFIVLAEKVSPPIQKMGERQQTIQWELSPQVLGVHTITLFAIPFHSHQHKPVELISGLYSVEVAMPKDVDLAYEGTLAPLLDYPPAPTLKVSPNISFELKRQQEALQAKEIPFYWIAIVLFLICLIPILYFRPKLYKKIRLSNPKKEALTTLKKLDQKSDYATLTNIVRIYLEKQYHLKATTSTTEEFLKEMSAKPILQKESVSLLKTFLQDADRVKFAHYTPKKDEVLHAIHSAKVFIEGA